MKDSHRTKPVLSGLSILCIDNYIESLEILRVTLQLEGANVVTASTSNEALFVLKQTPIDAVLCDLLMPEENGIALLHKLRAAGFQGPALAITGVSDPKVEASARSQGFSAYLVKPIEIDHLVSTISSLLPGAATRMAS